MRWKIIICLLLFVFCLPSQVSAATYYVATNGNDTNSGTATAPFKTLQKGVSILNPGDTLYVRSGTYLESSEVLITRSGTANAPITISTAPGESSFAILSGDINGNKLAELESNYWFLVQLAGSYIHFQNFEIAFAPRVGIRSDGQNNVISGNNVHHTRYSGISIHAPNNIVEDNIVWRTADYNCCPTSGNPYACGTGTSRQCNGDWPGGISFGDTSGPANPAPNTIIRHNIVFHTSGEGIICMNTDGGIIEDNISYDDWALGIDIDQCSNTTIQRNLVDYTTDKTWWRDMNNPGHAIMLSNEGQLGTGAYPIGHDRKVINNIMIGSNFRYWSRTAGAALKNDLIANNTIVNNQGVLSLLIDAPYDSSTTHSNTRFTNNIIYQSSGSLSNVPSLTGLTFDHNLWSRNSGIVSGAGDIIGDPLLTAPTVSPCTLITTHPDSVHPQYTYETLQCNGLNNFKLQSNSLAINKAVDLPQVTNDYFGVARPIGNAPDIGVHEYGGVSSITPTIAVSPTLVQTGTRVGVNVLLHGIGNGGDNVNPNSGGNMNPLHTLRTISIDIINGNNNLVGSLQGSVNFTAPGGNFQGIVQLNNITSGPYIVKIGSPQYLKKTIVSITQLQAGQLTSLPSITLTTGDVNGDNKLDILDYNNILDCFSDLGAPRNCADANKKQMTDLTDDGVVNQFDYNLFLRELSVQPGQ